MIPRDVLEVLSAAEDAIETVLVGDGETEPLAKGDAWQKADVAMCRLRAHLRAAGWQRCDDCGVWRPAEELVRNRVERRGRIDRRCTTCAEIGTMIRTLGIGASSTTAVSTPAEKAR